MAFDEASEWLRRRATSKYHLHKPNSVKCAGEFHAFALLIQHARQKIHAQQIANACLAFRL